MHPDAYSELCHICKNRETLCNSRNSGPWHIDDLGILRALAYLIPDIYSEVSQRFRMECFAKIVKSSYFSKIADLLHPSEHAHISISAH